MLVSTSAIVRAAAVAIALGMAFGIAGCGKDKKKPFEPTCDDLGGGNSVDEPELVHNLQIGNTGWFSSPAVYDLDGDGAKEIVAPFYDIAVWSASGDLLHQVPHGADQGGHHEGRVYPPAVVADLEGDGVVEVVVAAGEGTVAAYEWLEGQLQIKAGWPTTTCIADSCFENRSLGADDLDGDGTVEIVVSSTRSEQPSGYEGTNPHVFVFEPDGSTRAGWPRYDTRTGEGTDLPGAVDGFCAGHSGFGSYGLNVGVGDIDDDDDSEILVTYDNHHIQAFNEDGTALSSDPSYFSHRGTEGCDGEPMSWGQFIRWLDPEVEEDHYHLHQGEWPHPDWTMWLQWTHSPPSVGDINGDGLNEVIGVPNVEQDTPYHTYHYAVMVLEGDYEANGHRSARRLPGWEVLPLTEEPLYNDDWYPPSAVPAPTLADIADDTRLEILTPSADGFVYALSPDADLLWRYDYSQGQPLMYASEIAIADLSGDGRPEIVFGTYGEPGTESGRLVILSSNGEKQHDFALTGQNLDSGNGVGACAAPTIDDVDGDGELEILLLTIDHGLDVYTVPGSACSCVPAEADPAIYCGLWPTGRGNYLRNGRVPGT
jgi:hypothetical protein